MMLSRHKIQSFDPIRRAETTKPNAVAQNKSRKKNYTL